MFTLVMVRELLALLLHEHVPPLGRVLARVRGEGARRGGGRPARARRAHPHAGAHAHAGAHEARLVLRRRRPHLLLLRAQHLLLLLLQRFGLLLARYARRCDAW